MHWLNVNELVLNRTLGFWGCYRNGMLRVVLVGAAVGLDRTWGLEGGLHLEHFSFFFFSDDDLISSRLTSCFPPPTLKRHRQREIPEPLCLVPFVVSCSQFGLPFFFRIPFSAFAFCLFIKHDISWTFFPAPFPSFFALTIYLTYDVDIFLSVQYSLYYKSDEI